jgi:hypothetical protein
VSSREIQPAQSFRERGLAPSARLFEPKARGQVPASRGGGPIRGRWPCSGSGTAPAKTAPPFPSTGSHFLTCQFGSSQTITAPRRAKTRFGDLHTESMSPADGRSVARRYPPPRRRLCLVAWSDRLALCARPTTEIHATASLRPTDVAGGSAPTTNLSALPRRDNALSSLLQADLSPPTSPSSARGACIRGAFIKRTSAIKPNLYMRLRSELQDDEYSSAAYKTRL